MEISQTKDIRLSRSALFGHLSAREDDSWTERTVYITSESLQGKSATPVLSGPAIEAVIKHVGTSDTGLVLFRREEEVEVVEPPVPVPMDAILEDQDLLLLEDIFDDAPTVGVILLRLGRFAVGVLEGETLLATKTEGRYVKNRHKAGGSSQRRFERSRERLVRELYDKTCEVAKDIFEPRQSSINHVFLGGERHILNGFRKRCGFLKMMDERIMKRILEVGEPNQSALESIHKEVFSSRLRTFRVSI